MNENWRWNLPVEKSIASIGWDPEGKVSIGYEDGSLSLLDVKEEKPGKDWSVDSRFPIVDHCWINKGSVCCTSGRNISIFDCEKNKQSTTLVGHLDYVLCLKKNKTDNFIVSAGDDQSLFVWDIRTHKPINYVLAHSSTITSIDIFSDSSVEKDYFSRVWDVHNGECLRTVILSNSPPLTQGKFTKTSDIGLFSSLNSRITLFNIKSGKTIREYKGHENNDYIVEFGFTQTLGGDLDGFITGSENGMVHRYKWKNETPIDSLKIDSEGSTADLILTAPGFFVASGRTWSSVHKILY